MTPAKKSHLVVLAAVGVFSLVLVLLVHGIYHRFREVVVEQARAQQLAAATEAAQELDRFIAGLGGALGAVISNPAVLRELRGAGPRPTLDLLLEDMLRRHQGVAAVGLLDEELQPVERQGAGLAADPDLAVRALRERREVVGEQLVWQEGQALVQVAVPAPAPRDAAPRAAGWMLIRLEAALGSRVLPAFRHDETVWVLSRDGTTVWHPRRSKIGKPMLSQHAAQAPRAEPASLTAVVQEMRAGHAGSGIYGFSSWRSDPLGLTQKIAGYAPALGGALSIGTAVEYGAIAGPIHRYALRVGALGVAFLVLIGAGTLFYLRGARRVRQVQSDALSQLHHALSVSPAAVYHLKRGPSGQLEPVFLSPSLQESFGYEAVEWHRGPQWWLERIHPQDRAATEEAWQALLSEGRTEHRFRFRHSAGHYVWVRDVARLLRDAQGEPAEVVGSWQDVTAGQQAEERLRLADRLFENAVEGAFVADGQQRMLRVNEAFSRMTGYSPDEFIGQPSPAVRPEYQDFDFEAVVGESVRAQGSWSGEILLRHRDGSFFPGRMSLSAVTDGQGRPTHFIGLITDLSTQRELEQTVRRLSHYDPITSLPNRVLLMEHLAQELNEAAHRRERLAVLFLDLDRFKQINESLGREIGDRILRTVATRLQYGLEAGAILTQPGGDQFVVILPALKDAAHAAYLAAEIGRLIGEPLELDDIHLEVSASVGISVYPEDGADAQVLMHHAEAAMYHVKGSGGGAYQFFTSDLNDRALRRLKLMQALREAIPRHELKLAYQPQLELAGGRVIGAEALLRWESAELGLVSPAEFIPLAEESGLIIAIGEWVLREACRQAAGWQAYGPVRVGVNLSLRQFQAGTLKQTVDKVLAETGLRPGLLELEITESLAMADPDGTTRTLDSLRELGIRLALDDFGTGYSSLAYLQRLPLDTLKIDRAFIEHLETKQDDVVLTGTIISMAHALGLKVIAEGVESARQLEVLREHGCDEIQGYFLSRPLYASDFESWLAEHRQRLARGAKPARRDLV